MRFQLLVDFDSFWASLSRDIHDAETHTFVQTFSFEGDRIGKLLADTLSSSRAPDRRILVDSFSKMVLSDKVLYAPCNWGDAELRSERSETQRLHATLATAGVQIKYGNTVGFSPRRLLKRNHKKLILIDDRVAYIGGINFSEHNAAWHDMMLRIEDVEIARLLREDFVACWAGESRARSQEFHGAEIHTLDGRSNRKAFERIFWLIDHAQSSIFVASPYLSFPFYDHLKDAGARGVSVTVLTPQTNNWCHFTDYARWESTRCNLNLRLDTKGMSHLKAMLIDDQFLVMGSSNFDFLSYRIYEEILAVITEPDLIASFREQVMVPDLLKSERIAGPDEVVPSGWARWRVKLFNKSLTVLLE